MYVLIPNRKVDIIFKWNKLGFSLEEDLELFKRENSFEEPESLGLQKINFSYLYLEGLTLPVCSIWGQTFQISYGDVVVPEEFFQTNYFEMDKIYPGQIVSPNYQKFVLTEDWRKIDPDLKIVYIFRPS